MTSQAYAWLGAGIAIGLAALGTGIGIGLLVWGGVMPSSTPEGQVQKGPTATA